jgi:hypothetical protein
LPPCTPWKPPPISAPSRSRPANCPRTCLPTPPGYSCSPILTRCATTMDPGTTRVWRPAAAIPVPHSRAIGWWAPEAPATRTRTKLEVDQVWDDLGVGPR